LHSYISVDVYRTFRKGPNLPLPMDKDGNVVSLSTLPDPSDANDTHDDYVVSERTQPPQGLKENKETMREFQSLWNKVPEETWIVDGGVSLSFADGMSLVPGNAVSKKAIKT
jgi:hypothetical protein